MSPTADRFVDVDAGIAETVRTVENLLERWPETDVHAGSLIDTLLFLAERLEQGMPLSRPSASTALRQFAQQRAQRRAEYDASDDDQSDDDEGGGVMADTDQLILDYLNGKNSSVTQPVTDEEIASAVGLGLADVRESLRRLDSEHRVGRDGQDFWTERD